MSEETEGEDRGAELVERFVVVASTGGPYDDDSFVAGAYYGLADVFLTMFRGSEAGGFIVPSALVPQLDLLAMRHGYQCVDLTTEATEGWSTVGYIRAGGSS